jgi:hypothetical protein
MGPGKKVIVTSNWAACSLSDRFMQFGCFKSVGFFFLTWVCGRMEHPNMHACLRTRRHSTLAAGL